MAAKHADTGSGAGNKWYHYWCQHDCIQPIEGIERFDSGFLADNDPKTPEGLVMEFLNKSGHSLEQTFEFLCKRLDPANVEKTMRNETWVLRSAALAMVRQNPFKFFDIKYAKAAHHQTFWRHQEGDLLLRLDSQTVAFWFMCSVIFGHPWIKYTTMT